MLERLALLHTGQWWSAAEPPPPPPGLPFVDMVKMVKLIDLAGSLTMRGICSALQNPPMIRGPLYTP